MCLTAAMPSRLCHAETSDRKPIEAPPTEPVSSSCVAGDGMMIFGWTSENHEDDLNDASRHLTSVSGRYEVPVLRY